MSKNLSKLFRAQAGEASRAPRRVLKTMDSPESLFTHEYEFWMSNAILCLNPQLYSNCTINPKMKKSFVCETAK